MKISIEKTISSKCGQLAWKMLPGLLNADPAESVRLLHEGTLLIQGKHIQIDSDVRWDNVRLLGRSEQRLVHMNAFIGDAVHIYQHTSDETALTSALEMALLWADTHTWSDHAGSMAYHDETTARRVAYWTRLTIATQATTIDTDQISRLRARLAEEAHILSQDCFYAGKNNHGMFQDFAILYYCALIDPSASRAIKSLERLSAYFEWSVAGDGVHKEHSPSYNYLIARNMAAHIDLFKQFDENMAARIEGVLARMTRYALHIIGPDGRYPPLGDTAPQEVLRSYRKTFPGSEKLTALEDCAVFPEGGYATFRNTKTPDAPEIFAILSASHHGSYHKHTDDLGLVLYANGWIIAESGPYGYDYSHPFSKHAYSSAGHSTLHAPTVPISSTPGKVSIIDWSTDGTASTVRAINLRYEGLSHQRTVTFDRNRNFLTIADLITGAAEHKKYILWQLAAEVKAVQNGLRIVLSKEDSKIADLMFEGDIKPDDIVITRGSADDTILGYRFPAFGQAQETTVIAIRSPQEVESWSLSTSIHIAHPSSPTDEESISLHSISAPAITRNSDGAKLSISAVCDERCLVAFYLNHNGKVISKKLYSADRAVVFDLPKNGGSFFVRAFFSFNGNILNKLDSERVSIQENYLDET